MPACWETVVLREGGFLFQRKKFKDYILTKCSLGPSNE